MKQLNATDLSVLKTWLNNANQILIEVETKPEYQIVMNAVAASEALPPQVKEDLALVQTLQRVTDIVSILVEPSSK